MENPNIIRGEDLLKKFKTDRQNLVDIILKSPDILRKKLWTINGILWYDRECKCNMSNSYIEFSCKACSIFARLVELDSKLNKITLSCGEKGDVRIKIISVHALNTKIQLTTNPNNRIQKIIAQNIIDKNCCSEIENLLDAEFYEYDPYTAQIIVGIFTNRLASDFKIRIPELLTGFICGGLGYFIREDSDNLITYTKSIYKYLEPSPESKVFRCYNEEDTKKILYSLILTLYRFSKVCLTLGIPSIDCIRVLQEEITYVINGKKINLPVIVTLEPTPMSSITINLGKKYRFCANTTYNEKCLNSLSSDYRINTNFINSSKTLSTSTPKTETVRYPNTSAIEITRKKNTDLSPRSRLELKNKDKQEKKTKPEYIPLYNLDKINIGIFLALRNNGIPIFGNSFDLYCIMFSIMSYYPIYIGIIKSKYLKKFWNDMWLPEDRDKINEKVKSYHNINCPSFENLTNDLLDFKLRADIVPHLYNLMIENI
jgi:hypothetical protein